jgi:transposase
LRVELLDGDRDRLRRSVAGEKKALQRDRYRVALLAGEGVDGVEQTREQIASAVGRSRQFVDEWVKRYRRLGIDGLVAGKAKGNKPALTAEELARFKARMKAGPTPDDDDDDDDDDEGRTTLRGRDARRILETEFGKPMTLGSAYRILHRAGLSCLRPRPRHRKNDAGQIKAWLDHAPFLSAP